MLSKIISKYSKNGLGANSVSVYSFETPVGKVCGPADKHFLYFVIFEDSKNFEKSFQSLCEKLPCTLLEDKNEILMQLEDEIGAYFSGNLKKFTVPVKTFGSEFQQTVWEKLQDLPYASTQTYGDLAKAIGRAPSHARAIGAACGANNHVVVIPCHRLVSSTSKGGYSCGIDRKEWLLAHEKKYAQ